MSELSAPVVVADRMMVHVKCCRVWLISAIDRPASCGICGSRNFERITQAEANAYEDSRG